MYVNQYINSSCGLSSSFRGRGSGRGSSYNVFKGNTFMILYSRIFYYNFKSGFT